MAIQNFPAHLNEKVKESFNQYAETAQMETAYSMLFKVSDSNDYSRGYTTIEGGDTVGYFGENEDIQTVTIEEGYQAVGTSEEFGGKITISKKEMLNAKDETTLFNDIVDNKIPLAVNRMSAFVEVQAHTLFNDGFTTALSPDGVEIFGTHNWNSTTSQFTNRSGTNIVAGEGALTELEAYAGAFTDASGTPDPSKFNTLVAKTGGSASKSFKQVLQENNGVGLELIADTITNVNIYKGGIYTLVETPYITSDTAWFAHANNKPNSFIMDFIQRPEVEEVATRENLAKVYVTSASFRFGNYLLPTDWYGSDGTGV